MLHYSQKRKFIAFKKFYLINCLKNANKNLEIYLKLVYNVYHDVCFIKIYT